MIGLRKDYTPILMLLLLLAAFSLRAYGLNWDDGHLFHPDERHILMVTQRLALPDPLSLSSIASPASPLNPHSFAYGSLPFYLLAAVTQLLVKIGPLIQGFVGHPIQADLPDMRLIGRIISALFDTGTVLLTYLLGKRLYGRHVGMLGAAFVAFAVVHIQLAHFYASDTILTFFVVLSMLAAVELTKRAGIWESALVGGAIGLAMATKVSAAPIWGIVLAAHALRLFTTEAVSASTSEANEAETNDAAKAKGRSLVQRVPEERELSAAFASLAASVAVAATVFVVAQPYVVFDFSTFARNVVEQNDMVRGIADLPYTRQYMNTPPYLYSLQNLVVWGLGIPLGLIALGGLAYCLVRTGVSPRRQDILLLSWVVPYFLITGSFHAKFLRYLLPMVPFVCILGAVMLVALPGLRSTQRHRDTEKDDCDSDSATASSRFPFSFRHSRMQSLFQIGVWVVGGVVVLATLVYAVGFVGIYSTPHTAVQGSRWIYANVPKGAAIAIEHWEEGMPVPIVEGNEGLSAGSQRYRTNVLELYEGDGPGKQNHIVEKLLNSDYIVFFSNRLYGTIPRLPERYPLTTQYYQLLFGEQLGFDLVAAFTSYPNLLGITLMDDTFGEPRLPVPPLLGGVRPSPVVLNPGKADESFTVYDHPKVMVFKKTQQLSADELRRRLGDASPPPPKTGLMLNDEQSQKMVGGGTFAQMFDRNGIENRIPVAIWVVLVQLLGLAATPLAFKALGNLPDRGYGVAKGMGLLLLAWSSWLVASTGLLPNTRATIAVMLLLEVMLGAVLFFWQRSQIVDHLRARRGLIIASELVFWGAFALFLSVRMANPDLWHPYRGGEKPMDVAYLMAVIKSVQFPPYDPWFAGGYMNYYYFGQVVVATLIKLSGILPTTAYNLAVPLLAALTAGGVFTATYGLVAKAREARLSPGGLATGLFAVMAALLLGNLGGIVQIFDQVSRFGASGSVPAAGFLPAFVRGSWLLLTRAQAMEIPSDWYWGSTRIIQGTINEFPFFTFLYGDLHAHMIALPFTTLALAFAVHFIKAGNGKPEAVQTDRPASARPATLHPDTSLSTRCIGARPSLWSLAPAALVLGALYVTNSWDFPTYSLILGLAVVLPWYHGRHTSWKSLLGRGIDVVVIAALSIGLYLPFHRSFQSFYFGVDPFPDKSDFRGYLVIHGLFMFALVSYLSGSLIAGYRDSGVLRTIYLVLRSPGRLERLVRLYRRLVRHTDSKWLKQMLEVAFVLAFLAFLWWMKLQLAAVLAGLLFTVLLVLAVSRRRLEDTFVLLLFAVGLALGIVVEFFAIKGDIGRMNTVFKFYLQVWVLWSVASAYAVHWVLRRLQRPKLPGPAYIWLGALALLVCGAAVFSVVGVRARVGDRFDNSIAPTLDGIAYMRTGVFREQNGNVVLASDLKAIRWMQDNIPGSPVILEAQTPLYRWGSRISIYTGLPTVLGWDWHQKQQRWGYQWMVERRARDIAAIYASLTADQAMVLLREYRVAYVYVGELERLYYPAVGLQKFDAMVGNYLEVVFDDLGVKIYKVKG